MSDAAVYRAERDLARQGQQHQIRRARELERLLAGFIASAQGKHRCKCETAKALRALADELGSPERRP